MLALRLFSNPSPFRKRKALDGLFVSDIKGGCVPKEYIPVVQKGIESILGTGVVAGFPVLGLKATLIDGAYHEVDSSTMDFEIAGRAATGLRKAIPPSHGASHEGGCHHSGRVHGRHLGDINSRRGLVGELGERVM
jgi:elongation factor G